MPMNYFTALKTLEVGVSEIKTFELDGSQACLKYALKLKTMCGKNAKYSLKNLATYFLIFIYKNKVYLHLIRRLLLI